ncbi:MAG: 4-alpha-glucanotransferase [Verrucomicrobiales bacterium]
MQTAQRAPAKEGMSKTEPLQETKVAGVLVPVFAIRTEDDLGIGDVQGVRRMIDWLSQMGMGFLQVLPINEIGRDNSPYNAISSVALEPTTLDCSPQGLPDLTEHHFEEIAGGARLEYFRTGPIQYERVKRLKHDLLWQAFENFWARDYSRSTQRDAEFHRYCAGQRGWLGDYCLYRLLMDMEGGSEMWNSWSEDYCDIAKARAFVETLLELDRERTEKQLAYYAYVQWVARTQWEDTRDYARLRGVQLMGDVPFGISYHSVDVFCNPQLFDLEWSGGAPPETNFKDDEFTQKWGQNWGIPLYRWDAMEADGFAWWKQRIEKLTEIFSSFRLDHALGFYRIYSFPWRPERNGEFLALDQEEARRRTGDRLPRFSLRDDDCEENRALNRSAGEKYLRVICEAAGEAEVIAEDLGMVPDYVGPSLRDLGIPGMKVPMWQVEDGAPRPGSDYPYLSMATYATHDHEPLRTQWKSLRRAAGKQEGSDAESARHNLGLLAKFAALEGDPQQINYTENTREAFLRAIFASESKYVSVMITDLLGLEQRFNVPGVVGEANWTTRMETTMEDLLRNRKWIRLAAKTRKLLDETGRVGE